ncbi:MAG TPA: hypothetical protein VNH43_00065, partial [Vicinamibacteria bacterium]|nr:hypothetical protein [Vicinamibacteria bacterium]
MLGERTSLLRREIALRSSLLAASIVVALASWSCSGSSSSSNGPTAPAPPSPAARATTINIQGDRGAQSFAPNPGTVVEGNTVIWQNMDTQTHHIVLNDGS